MKITALVLVALVLSSCSTFDAVRYLADTSRPAPDAPAADKPADKPVAETSKVDAAAFNAAAKAEWNRYSAPANSARTFPAGLALETLSSSTFQGGEWAVYRILENGKVKSVLKMAVVGKDSDAWIYEFVSYTEQEATAFQEAIKGLEDVVRTGNSDKAEIVWIKVRGKDGKIETMNGAMLGIVGGSYKSMLTANSVRNPEAAVPGGSITVPAGTFTATWRVDSQVSQGKTAESGSAWVSTLVPVWHMVKSVSQNGKTVIELVDFGTSGYQSALK